VKRLAIAFALIIAAGGVAAAQTLRQTPGSQITVSACDPHQHTAGTSHPWIDPYGMWHPGSAGTFPYTEGFLGITYANTAPKVAKEVDFGLVLRGSLVAIANDLGTFSPGVQIAHEFDVSPEIFPIGTSFPYCAVLRVKYADGTEWYNPKPPQD
jgi:hypothetical protein